MEGGICSKCQVSVAIGYFAKLKVKSDNSSLTSKNAVEIRYDKIRGLKSDRRLGCQAKIVGDIVIDVPPESQIHKQIIRKAVNKRAIEMSSATKLFYIEVEKPNMKIPLGDYDRVAKSLKKTWKINNIEVPINVIQDIQKKLRSGNWTLTCAVFQDTLNKKSILLESWPGYFSESIYGVALDLGSTTIAGHLCDLQSGKVISSAGLMNPQIKFGEDSNESCELRNAK